MLRQWLEKRMGQVAICALFVFLLAGYGIGTGPSVEFKPAVPEAGSAVVENISIGTENEAETLSPQLGFMLNGEPTALENGGRVPLGEGRIAEVFISPYPPDWQTDLHLFLMDKETFLPVTDVVVDLTYEMVFMDHGIDTQTGTMVKDGHYLLPLSFLMHGDWSVNTTVELPEGKTHLRFIVKFFP